jgi:thiopurine S-methyltransferase
MEEVFWKNAWSERNIGFHMSETNPFLVSSLKDRVVQKPGACLVPLCGKSLDMIYLRDQGHSVYGFEIARQGILEFFEENKIEYVTTKKADFEIFESKNLTIYCGDFFKIQKSDLPDFNLIYDRASNIALPLDMRQNYYKKIRELATDKTEMILMTMSGEDKGEGEYGIIIGPPFSITKEETSTAYLESCEKFELVEEKNMKINSKRLRDQGITHRSFLGYYFLFK